MAHLLLFSNALIHALNLRAV